MGMTYEYEATEPARAAVDRLQEPLVLEFGTPWCGYCQAAQPLIAQGFEGHAQVRHIKVEDGKGRPLGRSFGVKLWPTLVFLLHGQEVARVIRPQDAAEVRKAFQALAGAARGAD